MLRQRLLALCTIVFLVASCTPAATTPPSSKISFMVFGDPAEFKAYQSVVTAFQAANPTITVDLVNIPDDGDYLKRLTADIAAGTPADVVLLNYRRVPGFAVKSALQPLDDYLAKSTLIKPADFYEPTLNAFYWNNKLQCLPQNISSLVVYYNKALFDTAGVTYPKDGWTWDDFVTTATALTKDTNGDGTPDQYGVGVTPSLQRLAPFIWQNDGQMVDDDMHPEHLAFTVPNTEAAFQWFVDLQVKHHVTPDAVAAKAEGIEARFLDGTMGMYLNSRRAVPTLRESAKFDWDVAPLPQGSVKATILHADGFCMTAGSKNKDTAWKFIEFSNSPEGQKLLAATGRTVPSLKAVAESPAFFDPNAKPANSRVWLDVIPYIHLTPFAPNWSGIESTVDEEVERAFYGNATVEDAAASAIQRTAEHFELETP